MGRTKGGTRNGEGHVYKHCRLCGRPFRRFKSKLAPPSYGSFCTRACFWAAWHLFNLALETERLEPIFKELAAILKEEEKKKAAADMKKAA
jgi:hypothetical protein